MEQGRELKAPFPPALKSANRFLGLTPLRVSAIAHPVAEETFGKEQLR